MENTKVMKLPLWKKFMYALGQFGWALTSYGVGFLLINFYMSSESGDINFPPFFSRETLLFGLTIVGIIFAISRVFDAVTDPIIAGLSDRGKFKIGRRRFFLIISVIPFALLSYLAFVPIINGESTVNAFYIGVIVILFYLFMTMYVTPFFALLSEIGHNPDERLLLSFMISFTWALGTVVGTQIFRFQSMLEEKGMDSLPAFRTVVLIYAIVGFVFMLLPIIFIDESKYCEHHVSDESIFGAVKTAFKNKNFFKFTLSDFSYWVALTFIQTGLIYYVTILLEQPKETVSFLQLVMFALSFLFYIPVTILAKFVGKKRLMLVGFIIFTITYIFSFFLGRMDFLSADMQGYILVAAAAIPLAIFGILPNATIADIAESDGITTGNYKAGIFFGARTFMQKMGQAVAGLIFPSLLVFGKEIGDDFGIRLTALAAIVAVILGLVLLFGYNEKEINDILKTKKESEK